MIDLELPYPPSVNHYWRHVGARTLISRGGRTFRAAVCEILRKRGVRPLEGALAAVIDVHPPDRRRRDLDNTLKSLLDALARGGAYHDDSQIAWLTVRRQGVVAGGKVVVRLENFRDLADHLCAGGVACPLAASEQKETDMATKPRTCLKCGRPFDSAGPGNRICRRCARINAKLSRITEEELQKQRGAKRHNGERLEETATEDAVEGEIE